MVKEQRSSAPGSGRFEAAAARRQATILLRLPLRHDIGGSRSDIPLVREQEDRATTRPALDRNCEPHAHATSLTSRLAGHCRLTTVFTPQTAA